MNWMLNGRLECVELAVASVFGIAITILLIECLENWVAGAASLYIGFTIERCFSAVLPTISFLQTSQQFRYVREVNLMRNTSISKRILLCYFLVYRYRLRLLKLYCVKKIMIKYIRRGFCFSIHVLKFHYEFQPLKIFNGWILVSVRIFFVSIRNIFVAMNKKCLQFWLKLHVLSNKRFYHFQMLCTLTQ